LKTAKAEQALVAATVWETEQHKKRDWSVRIEGIVFLRFCISRASGVSAALLPTGTLLSRQIASALLRWEAALFESSVLRSHPIQPRGFTLQAARTLHGEQGRRRNSQSGEAWPLTYVRLCVCVCVCVCVCGQLGLHTVKVSSLARTPRSAGGGVQMRPNKGKLSKLLKRAGMPDTEMWLSNFASEDGFDLGQASVNEQQGTWSYNLEGGVFQRGRGAPVVVGAGVTKEQLVAREEFMVGEITRITPCLAGLVVLLEVDAQQATVCVSTGQSCGFTASTRVRARCTRVFAGGGSR
jgi:hypothetical protein